MMDNFSQPVVSLQLNDSGKQKFADATEKYLDKVYPLRWTMS